MMSFSDTFSLINICRALCEPLLTKVLQSCLSDDEVVYFLSNNHSKVNWQGATFYKTYNSITITTTVSAGSRLNISICSPFIYYVNLQVNAQWSHYLLSRTYFSHIHKCVTPFLKRKYYYIENNHQQDILYAEVFKSVLNTVIPN